MAPLSCGQGYTLVDAYCRLPAGRAVAERTYLDVLLAKLASGMALPDLAELVRVLRGDERARHLDRTDALESIRVHASRRRRSLLGLFETPTRGERSHE